MRRLLALLALPLLALTIAAAAAAGTSKDASAWAKPQIQQVVKAGFLADSAASFRGADLLDQQALQSIVEGLNAIFQAQTPQPLPLPVPTTTTFSTTTTTTLPTSSTASTSTTLPTSSSTSSSSSSTTTTTTAKKVVAVAPAWPLSKWKATNPAALVTVTEFDKVLVNALGLAPAAKHVRDELLRLGLKPTARVGTETVARLVGLRLNHPAGQDDLELLPDQPITRAEAAYSIAQVLGYDRSKHDWIDQAAQAFALPELTPWQQQILTTAASYVGFPYVWGGTSPTAENPAGVPAPGGFDCSGFVWRVYKLTSYADEGTLADTLRGRTTYQMSGEVGAKGRIAKVENLQPGDVLFFGKGPKSKPAQVDHTGIYLGNGWMVHSSGNGVTIVPFDGWYRTSFAWARRPLREAGLSV
jgi:cell wall-associated NlpC family hydrolase